MKHLVAGCVIHALWQRLKADGTCVKASACLSFFHWLAASQRGVAWQDMLSCCHSRAQADGSETATTTNMPGSVSGRPGSGQRSAACCRLHGVIATALAFLQVATTPEAAVQGGWKWHADARCTALRHAKLSCAGPCYGHAPGTVLCAT